MKTKERLNELEEKVWILSNQIDALNHKNEHKKITQIIDSRVIDQVKETARAINEFDKSIDRLKETLFVDRKPITKTYWIKPLGLELKITIVKS